MTPPQFQPLFRRRDLARWPDHYRPFQDAAGDRRAKFLKARWLGPKILVDMSTCSWREPSELTEHRPFRTIRDMEV
jgi:hypothetical protein